MKKVLSFLLLFLPLGLFAQIDYYEVISEAEATELQKADSLELQTMLKKAKSGDLNAQFELGYMYRTGKRPDERTIQVTREIGFLDYHSNSFYQDYEKAFFWLSKAAKKENADSENELGLLYEAGRGVEANPDSAFYWYMRAAKQCLPQAQNNVARLYFFGEGITTDFQKSYAWASIAYDNGITEVERPLAVLREKLSEKELQEAEKLKKKIERSLDCE